MGAVSIKTTDGEREVSVNLSPYATTGAVAASLLPYSLTTDIVSLLSSKVDDGQVLTNVPANALFTDTLPAANAEIAYITGLQTALDSKLSDAHGANNVGQANVDFGAHGITTRRMSLNSAEGVTLYFESDGVDHVNLQGTTHDIRFC